MTFQNIEAEQAGVWRGCAVIYGSLCSGIEAATQAWHPLGWKPAFFSEVDRSASAVLAHHYPDVPNLGDMTKFREWPDHAIDLLVGGTPCQSFSIAGLRKGLADPRGNLALTYLAILDRYRPRWCIWENVPGVYSATSHDAPDPCPPDIDLDGEGGPCVGEEILVEDEYDADESHAFACFLAGLQELGYGAAYRTLDAQYVRTRRHPGAVPQRRRRVFVVGYLGDWRRAAAVLFDGESLSGNPPPRREAGQRPAPTISARPTGGGGLGTDFDLDGGLICANSGEVGYCLTASAQQSLDAETETLVAVAHALRADGFDASEDGTGRGTPIVPVAGPLCRDSFSGGAGGRPEGAASGHFVPVAFDCKAGGETALSIGEVPGALRGEGHGGGHAAIAIQERAVAENPSAGPGGKGFNDEGAAYTLEARNKVQAVAFADNSRAELRLCGGDGNVSAQLTTGGGKPGQGQPTVATEWAVRRVTPVECERLQGFPDNYTRIPGASKGAWREVDEAEDIDELREAGLPLKQKGNAWFVRDPDGPRYKQLGNSMAVNVMTWIGERIEVVEGMVS